MTKEEWTAEAKRRAAEYIQKHYAETHGIGSGTALCALLSFLEGIAVGAEMMRERAVEVCEHYVDHEGHNPGHFIAPLIRALEIPEVGYE